VALVALVALVVLVVLVDRVARRRPAPARRQEPVVSAALAPFAMVDRRNHVSRYP
jgi:hypothetical protein